MLAVIFCGFISLLIGCETINSPEIFSGVHSFTEKTVIGPLQLGSNDKFFPGNVYIMDYNLQNAKTERAH